MPKRKPKMTEDEDDSSDNEDDKNELEEVDVLLEA